jgi:uncharacterized protein
MPVEGPVGVTEETEVSDGMQIERNVPIPMDDGIVLRANVFRPPTDGQYPAILNYGPYGKDLAFQDGFRSQWERLAREHPDALMGSTSKHQCWETVDPERWVPDGYAVVRVDSRGAGASPGVLDVRSPRETEDLAACIEWAAVQPWSNGKVGLCGISYYAMNQWLVAALMPPHLAAIIPWEGAGDSYRDAVYHGGILSQFSAGWFRRQVRPMQHGAGGSGEGGAINPGRHPLDDEWHQARSAEWSKVKVPLLSAANWGGTGLHLRGNIEGFMSAATDQKWLEVHGLEHWTHFYTPYGVDLQKRFLGCFLKGDHAAWDGQPRVQLNIRHVDGSFTVRAENEFPLARTRWTSLYLDLEGHRLSRQRIASPGQVTYDGLGSGVTFSTGPLDEETEITGHVAATLYVSSSTTDADLFLVVRVFDPEGREVTFPGASAPHAPVAQGWLRASHRALDRDRSLPYRPYHTHDRVEPLTPGEVYRLDIEIWPTCVVIPRGYQLALTVRGTDYEFEGDADDDVAVRRFKGAGPFTHDDPRDRPAEIFGGRVTIHAGGDHPSSLLLPVIPPD